MKLSSLAALEVVKMTTSSAVSDENFVKMTTFLFQCTLALGTPLYLVIQDDLQDVNSTFDLIHILHRQNYLHNLSHIYQLFYAEAIILLGTAVLIEINWTNIGIRDRMSNYSHVNARKTHVITHPCPHFKGRWNQGMDK